MPPSWATVSFRTPMTPDFPLPPILEPLRERFAASLRPAAYFRIDEAPPDALTGSRLGGAPYWPDGEPWPAAPDGTPLRFLVQINLEDVPALPHVPRSGLLQLFLRPDDLYGMELTPGDAPTAQTTWRIVYRADTSAPAAPPPLASSAQDAEDLWPLADPARARRLVFDDAVTVEPVNGSVDAFETYFGASSYAFAKAYAAETGQDEDAVGQALYDLAYGDGASQHKLGGWANFVQGDPQERDGVPRVLLLQLDSDDPRGHGLLWGDVGTAQWLIPEDDLERWNLSNVLYDWACG